MLHYWTSIRRLPPRFLPFPSGTVQKRNIRVKPRIKVSVSRPSGSFTAKENSNDGNIQTAPKRSTQSSQTQDDLKILFSLVGFGLGGLILFNLIIRESSESVKSEFRIYQPSLNRKIDLVDLKQSRLEGRMERLEVKVQENKEQLSGKLDRQESTLVDKLDRLESKLVGKMERLGSKV